MLVCPRCPRLLTQGGSERAGRPGGEGPGSGAAQSRETQRLPDDGGSVVQVPPSPAFRLSFCTRRCLCPVFLRPIIRAT